MMRYKKGISWVIVLFSFCCVPMIYADSLLKVYAQAVQNDPTFIKARAVWQSQKMNLPIARSSYLPQLTVLGNGARNFTDIIPSTLTTIKKYNWTYGYSLTLTQPVFDLAAWNAIKSASAVVKAATATYLAAQQSLMQRTAQAYFDVLKAYETLNYTIANKKAVWKQYIGAKKKYQAGLSAVMDMYDARSRYDQVTAQEITAQNNLSVKLENLHAITGHYYKSLNGFNKRLSLSKPNPTNIDLWTLSAVQQNYNLVAQRYNVISAMDKIKQQASGGIPTLDLSSGFTEAQASDNQKDFTSTDTTTLGLNLTYKPVQGGLVYASTKQARYNYVAASAELSLVYRQVVSQTHASYLGVTSTINRVNADRLRVISASKALVATQAGLKVGARTMVDVLNDLTTLYQAEQQFADDRYAYLNNMIDLKMAAGTLKEADLVQINHWLNKKVSV